MNPTPIVDTAMALADVMAGRSEDPHRKVGTCLLRQDRTVAALGYNGTPPRMDIDWSDREARRIYVVHAEVNALRYVIPGDVAILVSTSLPCASCMVMIAAYQVGMVIYRDELDPAIYDRDAIIDIASRAGIVVHQKGDISGTHEA